MGLRLLPCGVGDRFSAACGLTTITPQMRSPAHQPRFFTMGLFDTLGTFLTAMGAVFTPGQVQPLLNQSLIPATMICSCAFLGTRYSRGQLVAASLLVLGAALSVLPKVLLPPGKTLSSGDGDDAADATGGGDAAPPADGSTAAIAHPDDEARGYAVLLYWLSNLPMACSAVYKEARFSREPMDVRARRPTRDHPGGARPSTSNHQRP